MARKINKAVSMLAAACFCFILGTVSAFADVNPDTFNPRTGKYVYLIKSNNETFKSQGGDIVESVNSTSDGALIPSDPDYRYMIRNVYDSDYEKAKPYTEMLDGIPADGKYIDEMAQYTAAAYTDEKNPGGTYKNEINRSHFWWFKMSTEAGKTLSSYKAPKVKWSGLYIYDREKESYQNIDLYMEVTGHSMGGNFSNKVPALFSVSKGVNGLPSVRIYHVKAILLKFTAKKAGTDETYPLKTSITFGDIDGRQSVSVRASSASGFAARNSANILFGPYGSGPDQFWAATGNTDSNIDGNSSVSDNYKVAFYLNAGNNPEGNFELAFTSGQQDNNKPTGNFARFSASTYQNPESAPDSPAFSEPVKYTSDEDYTNDEDQGTVKINGADSPARTHNTLASDDEKTTYTVVAKVPPHMYSNIEECDVSKLEFSDKLDSCLEYVDGSMKIYCRQDGADIDEDLVKDPISLDMFKSCDQTDKFNVSFDEGSNTLSAEWKNDNTAAVKDEILYGNGDGSVIKYVFDVKIKEGLTYDDLADHVGADERKHERDGMQIDIPNQAEMSLRFRNQADIATLKSVNARHDDFVYTRIKKSTQKVNVEFEKVSDTGERLSGAELSVYEGEFPGAAEIRGEAIDTWTTGKALHVCEGLLEIGKTYTLVENRVPSGYDRAERIVFTVSGDGQKIVMTDIRRGHDLVITKNVTGSLGDITRRFKFVLELSGAGKKQTYKAVRGKDELTFSTDSNGSARFEFTLKDDERITVKDLPEFGTGDKAASFVVTEMPNDHKASYVTGAGGKSANTSSGKELKTKSFSLEDDYLIRFTNDKEFVPVTGVPSGYGPVAVLLLFLIIAFSSVIVKIR